jgi:hypothetical protein
LRVVAINIRIVPLKGTGAIYIPRELGYASYENNYFETIKKILGGKTGCGKSLKSVAR